MIPVSKMAVEIKKYLYMKDTLQLYSAAGYLHQPICPLPQFFCFPIAFQLVQNPLQLPCAAMQVERSLLYPPQCPINALILHIRYYR